MSGPPVEIRLARSSELPDLQLIERAAGELFRGVGMSEIADDEPLGHAELTRYHQAGHAWVAVGAAGRPVAYLLADLVDGNVHIEQVSVHPGSARRGLGRRLLEQAARHALDNDRPALTLTTFAHVPWNAPYYERCGFRILTESEWTAGLRAIVAREAAHGLARWPRVCMRQPLSRGAPAAAT